MGISIMAIKQKQTTPSVGNFCHLQTLYVVLEFYRSGDGDYPALIGAS